MAKWFRIWVNRKGTVKKMKSTLVIVGGFLGSGKTSLLWKMAEMLKENGEKVGLITNDQASGLVDTAFLETNTDMVREVSGSCFCCNFNGFVDAIRYIGEKNDGGLIFAEPVGSCTDLSATIMQPLKEKCSAFINLMPLTVLADPFKLKEILESAASTASYIILKQFEEADMILINKIDLISAEELTSLQNAASERWPGAKLLSVSVKTGEGLSDWFDSIVRSDAASGTRITEVDYDIYAEGEAAFGWLNATFSIEDSGDFDAAASAFLHSLARRFDDIPANVGHVKFLLQCGGEQMIGNITGSAKTATLKTLNHKNSEKNELTVNARVEMDPQALKSIILEEVDKAFGKLRCVQTALKCLTPGRPNPTYRYSNVI